MIYIADMSIHHKISKTVKVSRWGNSLAVRLPAELVRQFGLKEGEEVEVSADDGGAESQTVKLGVTRKETVAEMLDRLKGNLGRMPEGYKFDREEANARGNDLS